MCPSNKADGQILKMFWNPLWQLAHDVCVRSTSSILLLRHSDYSDRLLEQFMHKEAGHIVGTAVEARAGFLDRPTAIVLIVSTSLTIALFAALYIGFFAR